MIWSKPPSAAEPAGGDDAELMARSGAQSLTYVSLIYFVIAALLIVTQWVSEGRLGANSAWFYVVLLPLVLVLIRRGQVRAAILLFSWSIFASCLYAGLYVGGMQAPGLVALPMITLAISWLLGPRHGIAMAVAGVVALAGITWWQMRGLTPLFAGRTPPFMFVVYLGTLLVAALLGGLSSHNFLKAYRRSIALSGELAKEVEELAHAKAELHQLNETLEAKVAERTAQLQQMRDEMLDNERLAALGSMVAGISHELNTPIGNALVTADTLVNRAEEMRALFSGGQLKKSELSDFLGAAADMSVLTRRSVARAAELVASFKQVSIDQASERRRTFDLAQTVNDVMTMLQPQLKTFHGEVAVSVPPGIACDSFPGPFGQVLSNLVQNAVLHAFAERTWPGHIAVAATLDGAEVVLSVTDDGSGMDAATLARIFDPFFTTRLGQGGSGLGLTVSHRIAHNVLGGSLQAVSTPGAGSTFTLRFPQVAPGRI